MRCVFGFVLTCALVGADTKPTPSRNRSKMSYKGHAAAHDTRAFINRVAAQLGEEFGIRDRKGACVVLAAYTCQNAFFNFSVTGRDPGMGDILHYRDTEVDGFTRRQELRKRFNKETWNYIVKLNDRVNNMLHDEEPFVDSDGRMHVLLPPGLVNIKLAADIAISTGLVQSQEKIVLRAANVDSEGSSPESKVFYSILFYFG